jgi:signal transduction histidine kinase
MLKEILKRINPRTLVWIFAALAVSLASSQLNLHFFEAYFYDWRVSLKPKAVPSTFIEMAFIDLNTVQKLKSVPSVIQHTIFLEQLLKENPRGVIYLLSPEDLKGSTEEKLQFTKVAKQFRNFYFVTKELELRGEEGRLLLKPPFEGLREFSGLISADKINLAKDGVTRRMMLAYQGRLLLHPYLASQINPPLAIPTNIRGRFDFFDTDQVYIDFLQKDSYPKTSFYDIATSSFTPGRFKDSFIFLGFDLGQNSSDYIQTPFSKDIKAMTSVEAHANMLDSVVRNKGPIQTPKWINLIFSFLIALITFRVVMSSKPARGLLILALTLVSFSVICFVAFWPFGIWIEMAHPFLTIFLCYYFLIPYRLIIENRRSWEYFQKNKLLTQVEELKTNFISMMSHDLKTPLARIQGMAEMIQRDKTDLSAEQKASLDMITKSTEDLVKFINSIVNFSRIESEGVRLNLKSKDINALLEDIIHKHEFLAHQKNIKIRTELEPLFSIQVDPELIRQVFSNLIENAIKYSPEGSKVLVSSEENENKIVIQFADQGNGIPPDEINSIFMKFFRSKHAKTSTIKGSGIGLYLAKYFTELHGGTLNVESTLGQGSTFTVELPIGISSLGSVKK